MELDEYQNLAVESFEARNHVAIIGAAGTGKSHVLLSIIERARQKYGSTGSVACAWSNNAARTINGITLHKLFSAKTNWEWTGEGLWDEIQRKPKILDLLLQLKVLIIDEIFTIKSNVFEAIDYVLRGLVKTSWHKGLPLGGRLLVVSGDPYQLEPMFPKHEKHATTVLHSSPWYHCFGSDASGTIVILPNNHRQASDPRFFSILSRLRVGTQNSEDLRILNSTSHNTIMAPKSHTRLVLTHGEAERINKDMLNAIQNDLSVSLASDVVFTTSEREKKEVEDRLAQASLRKVMTKVGGRVLLTRKCQDLYPGADLLVTDIKTYYINGGTHETHSLCCVPYSPNGNPNDASEQTNITLIPMRTPIYSASGELLAYREQLPIVPAYAITVHRSQSLSLRRVAIDFRSEDNYKWNPFGKVYVALSRCRTLQGLWVHGLRNDHIRISPSASQLMAEIDILIREVPSRVIHKKSVHPSFRAAQISLQNSTMTAGVIVREDMDNPPSKRIRLEGERMRTL